MFSRSSAIIIPALASSANCLGGKARIAASRNTSRCSADTVLQEQSTTAMRVVTYNIRRFKGSDGKSTVSAVGDALAALRPTIVALNEVDIQLQPEGLALLAEKLGGFSVAFFGHVRGRYGNSLLSKYPIVAMRETHLRGGTEFFFPAGTKKYNGEIAKENESHRIARGLLECDIQLPPTSDGPGRVLTVAITHLDHINEEQRVIQLTHVLETIAPNSSRALLVGDLNALHRSDYKDEEWEALENRAKANNWSPPASGCLALLEKAGYTDAFVASRGHGPLSARAHASNDPIFSAHVDHPLYRIDYCFVSSASGLMAQDAKVHTEIALSDHFPVSFDFHAPHVEAHL